MAKDLARQAGFPGARVASAENLESEALTLRRWVEQGRAGDMKWFTQEHVDRVTHPASMLPHVRSVISLAAPYWSGPRPSGTGRGKIARYAWGCDYHAVIGERLTVLAEALCAAFGGGHRWFVDAGPALDRAWAVRSGLGWQGKNTNVFVDTLGSFVFLAEIFTTVEIAPDSPLSVPGCGSCRLCVTACPTGAIGPEYSIDSRRCISYLTIEHRGPIPVELRPLMGSWVFGCDICQDVCPPAVGPQLVDAEDRRAWVRYTRQELGGEPGDARFGQRRTESTWFTAEGQIPDVDLHWLLTLSHDEYLRTFRGSAIRRAKVWMLRRNAAIALGNVGLRKDVDTLTQALRTDEHPIVRGHAAWAIFRIADRLGLDVTDSIRPALDGETNPSVRAEIEYALGAIPDPTP